MHHRIIPLFLTAAALLVSACGEQANTGGEFDCALWRKRASDAAASVARQGEEIQFVPYKGLGDTRRRDAMRRLQNARASAARLEAQADRACAALPED